MEIPDDMPNLRALADQVGRISSFTHPCHVLEQVRAEALRRALGPEAPTIDFADGDVIAWRVPEAMTDETVHRTAVYLERRKLWVEGNGNVIGSLKVVLADLRAEHVSDVCYIPASARIPLT